jgi:hypothetical protein
MDLIQAYFQRDLSEAEEDALSRRLKSSPEDAMRLLALAERAYAESGLPEPRLKEKGAGGFLKFLGALALAALAGLGWLRLSSGSGQAPEAPRSLELPSQGSFRTIVPRPAHEQPKAHPKPLSQKPKAAVQAPASAQASWPKVFEPAVQILVDPSDASKMLVRVILGAAAPLKVRVLDSEGQELQVLQNGSMPQGRWDFNWEGPRNASALPAKESYIIEVRSGRFSVRRAVSLERK